MLKIFKRKCLQCEEKQRIISQLVSENHSLREKHVPFPSEKAYIEKLEKEVGYWKEKALNFKKFHI